MSHVEVFPGKRQNDYYFRSKAANGETVTISEGYTREDDAVRAARRHIEEMRNCDNIVRVIPRETKAPYLKKPKKGSGKGKESK